MFSINTIHPIVHARIKCDLFNNSGRIEAIPKKLVNMRRCARHHVYQSHLAFVIKLCVT